LGREDWSFKVVPGEAVEGARRRSLKRKKENGSEARKKIEELKDEMKKMKEEIVKVQVMNKEQLKEMKEGQIKMEKQMNEQMRRIEALLRGKSGENER